MAGFETCFKTVKSGDFSGSLSSVLRLKKYDAENVVTYKFDNEKLDLHIVYDKDTVYDVSRKHYLFQGNGIKLRYSTYALANCFEIIINGDTCNFNCIDGTCDLVMIERQENIQASIIIYYSLL
jgi:hypothetical protein